jgi:hypothetical protein
MSALSRPLLARLHYETSHLALPQSIASQKTRVTTLFELSFITSSPLKRHLG